MSQIPAYRYFLARRFFPEAVIMVVSKIYDWFLRGWSVSLRLKTATQVEYILTV
jgi:hypothetical protein